MYKLIFKVCLMLGLMLGISNYMMYIMTGKTPFSSPKDLLPDFSPTLTKMTPKLSKETVYKWTDDKGRVHYSSDPIHNQANVEKMQVDPNLNVMDSVEIPKNSDRSKPNINLPEGNIYTPDKIQQLVKDAKNVQNLMDDRAKQFEGI